MYIFLQIETHICLFRDQNNQNFSQSFDNSKLVFRRIIYIGICRDSFRIVCTYCVNFDNVKNYMRFLYLCVKEQGEITIHCAIILVIVYLFLDSSYVL